MKKVDEIRLFNLLRSDVRPGEPHRPANLADAYFAAAEIHPARGYMCLDKWARNQWWEYGVSLRAGWFTDKAPASLVAQPKASAGDNQQPRAERAMREQSFYVRDSLGRRHLVEYQDVDEINTRNYAGDGGYLARSAPCLPDGRELSIVEGRWRTADHEWFDRD